MPFTKIFFLHVLLWPLGLLAQNLVPNPGFESFSTCPSNSCQWNFTSNWGNVNGLTTCNSSTGSPDYFNACGTSFYGTPLTLNGHVNPLSGNGMMGLSTWLSFSSDFREYLSVPLSSPLQAGNAYTLSFHYTNGVYDAAVNYGGAGTRLGVHFSVGPLSQTGSEPILLTPTYESAGPLFNTSWQLVSFFFIAPANCTHLTIGNFRNDASTAVTQFLPASAPGFTYAYYYFDDLVVEEEIVLPVNLLDFQGNQVPEGVQLYWETAKLTSSSLFQVERSTDGIQFEFNQQLVGAKDEQQFQAVDNFPVNGSNYYRLRYQMDDGTEGLSNTIEVVTTRDLLWRTGPNPLIESKKLTLSHNSPNPESARFLVWDMQGKITFSTSLTTTREAILDLSSLAGGVYTLQIIGQGNSWQQRLIVP